MTANAIKMKTGFAANEINIGKNLYNNKPTNIIKITIVIITAVVSLLMILGLKI